jgi:hypothetical protein
MNAFSANPFAYIFPLVLLVGFGGYYLYGAVDRIGVPIESVDALVTGKQFTPGGTTYNTNIAAGRAWTQSNKTNDMYAIELLVGKEATVGLVDKRAFERLNKDDHVQVKIRRTRISGRLEVVEVVGS